MSSDTESPKSEEKKKSGGTTILELIDLALCSPEVGAVNFNVLRMCLRDIVEKTGIDQKQAKLNDVEASQLEV